MTLTCLVQVVFLTAGINDFHTEPIPQADWLSQYVSFIREVCHAARLEHLTYGCLPCICKFMTGLVKDTQAVFSSAL